MSLKKEIAIGSIGKLVLSQENGKASLELSMADQAGGGPLAGFAKVELAAKAEIDEMILVEVGLDVIEAKYPVAKSLIEGLKAIIKADLAKV